MYGNAAVITVNVPYWLQRVKSLLILPHFMQLAVPRMAFRSANTNLEVD
jgi:hypothetical protein